MARNDPSGKIDNSERKEPKFTGEQEECERGDGEKTPQVGENEREKNGFSLASIPLSRQHACLRGEECLRQPRDIEGGIDPGKNTKASIRPRGWKGQLKQNR